MTLGKKGVAGDDTSRDAFNQPNAVGFAPNGDVYVSDGYSELTRRPVHGRRQVRADHRRQEGRRPRASCRCRTGWRSIAQGRIIVADSDNKRLSVFDKDGRFVKIMAAPSRGGLVVTPDDTIYVSDVNAGAVTVIKNDQIVDVIKVEGRPHGLAVDPATGDVYTSSTNFDHPNVTKASPKKPVAAK